MIEEDSLADQIVAEVVRREWKRIRGLPNVVGYSRNLQPRIRAGRAVPEERCFRVYVKKKVPLASLTPKGVIPQVLQVGKEQVLVDIVEIGEPRIPPLLPIPKELGPTDRWRPVIFGISIGNEAITAGSNGWLFADGNGKLFFGSNAHVFTDDDPSKEPSQVVRKNILQPGPYDGGTGSDKVADYLWHLRIIPQGAPSGCPIARFWASIYNTFAGLLGRRTRLAAITQGENQIDFSVAEVTEKYEARFPDSSFAPKQYVGEVFAGSESVGVVCKAEHIVESGYSPYGVEWVEVVEGDWLEKYGRTSKLTRGRALDASAFVSVSYGTFVADFSDVILIEGGDFVKGEDSGSSTWKAS